MKPSDEVFGHFGNQRDVTGTSKDDAIRAFVKGRPRGGYGHLMAKTYRLTPAQRTANSVFRTMTRLGIGANYRHILTVRGRKSGELRSTPVDVLDLGGNLWLVAPYGISNWVRNVRASGEVSLTRGRSTQKWQAEEVDGSGAVPVLRNYMSKVRVTRPYFDATSESSDEDLLKEVPGHPVFRLVSALSIEGTSEGSGVQ